MARIPGIYKRGATWTVHCQWRKGGEVQQHKKGGFKKQSEAAEYRAEFLRQIRLGRHVPVGKRTTGEYLTAWIDTLATSGRRPTTIAAYRWLVTKHVVPELGDIALRDLTGIDIDRLYAAMVAKGLTLRTVRHCHSALRRALADAVEKGVLPSNPALAASPPKVSATRAPETAVWTPDELAAFFERTADHHLGALVRVAGMTGLRRGELCGLRWADIDLDGATLTVLQTIVTVRGAAEPLDVKSAHSRRTVDLDPATVKVLRRHEKTQKEWRLLAGPGWNDTGLVFTNPSGAAWHPDTVSATVQRLIDASGLPRVTLHGLRHSHITHLLVVGVDVKTVSARAGHASAAFTLDRYGHVLAGRQAAAAAAVAALVDGTP